VVEGPPLRSSGAIIAPGNVLVNTFCIILENILSRRGFALFPNPSLTGRGRSLATGGRSLNPLLSEGEGGPACRTG
jgi:hypothetical protein